MSNNIVGFVQTKIFEDPNSEKNNRINEILSDRSLNKGETFIEDCVKDLSIILVGVALLLDICLRNNINCYEIFERTLTDLYTETEDNPNADIN